MKKWKRLYALILVGVLTFSMWGCGDDESEDDKDDSSKAVEVEQDKNDVVDGKIVNDAVMLTVGEYEVTYSEVMVYVNMIKGKYEPLFSEYIWDFEVDEDKKFEDLAKEEIINQIIRLKVMRAKSIEEGIELSEDEKLEIEDSAAEYLTQITKEQQKMYGINIDIITTIYEDNFIARKLFDVVTADVDMKVAKEDAHTVTVKQFVSVYKGRDKAGNVLKGSKEEKDAAKLEANKAFDQIVKNKNDFQSYALNHSDSEEIVVSISKGELDENIEKVVFSLKEKSTSAILDMGEGYYFFECIDADDEKAREEREDEIVKERQNDAFSKEYDEWLRKTEVYIVTELWNMIQF